MQMNRILITALVCVNLPIANALAIEKLNCTLDDGRDAGRLSIDLENRSMKHGGAPNFPITKVSQERVAGLQHNGDGLYESWVIDRRTGEFLRAGVVKACQDDKCNLTMPEIIAIKGTCFKSVF